jgi:hypothetical protein
MGWCGPGSVHAGHQPENWPVEPHAFESRASTLLEVGACKRWSDGWRHVAKQRRRPPTGLAVGAACGASSTAGATSESGPWDRIATDVPTPKLHRPRPLRRGGIHVDFDTRRAAAPSAEASQISPVPRCWLRAATTAYATTVRLARCAAPTERTDRNPREMARPRAAALADCCRSRRGDKTVSPMSSASARLREHG